LSLIATGGTIASRVDYELGGVQPVLSPQEIFFNAPEIAQIASFEKVLRPFTLWSENMTPVQWGEIAKLVAGELNAGADGVIITHGTDTLHYTSAALSFMLCNLDRPVVLVGAQRSPDRASFDGSMNLACAAHYAADAARARQGVVAIVMHATSNDDYCHALLGTKARKMHSSRRDAFRPINGKPLARIWPDGRIEKTPELRQADAAGRQRAAEENPAGQAGERPAVKADTRFEQKTCVIKAFPHSTTELLEFLIDRKYRGIVVESTGLGHAPTFTVDKKSSWLQPLKRAADEGVVVAFAPQTVYGRLAPDVYDAGRLLQKAGVVHCGDMLAETAYVKLGCVLGRTRDALQAKKMMLQNIAGETSEQSAYDEFLD
jgi:glutamyl-tRNA(Gln) amidotransferase subunit D